VNSVLSKLTMCVKVEVAHSKYKNVRFGARRICDVVKKQIALVNRSCAPVTFSLLISPDKEDAVDSSVLCIANNCSLTLPPSPLAGCKRHKAREHTKNIEVIFSPKKLMKPFIEEVGNSLEVRNCSATIC